MLERAEFFRPEGLSGVEALLRMHASFAAGDDGLERDELVVDAVAALRRHLRPGPPLPAGGVEHAAVRRARSYLTERWDRPVTLAELAAFAGLSRFELIRRFRQQTGLTPHAFQRNLRVARARTMLRAGAPIAEVAAAWPARQLSDFITWSDEIAQVASPSGPGTRDRNFVQDTPPPG